MDKCTSNKKKFNIFYASQGYPSSTVGQKGLHLTLPTRITVIKQEPFQTSADIETGRRTIINCVHKCILCPHMLIPVLPLVSSLALKKLLKHKRFSPFSRAYFSMDLALPPVYYAHIIPIHKITFLAAPPLQKPNQLLQTSIHQQPKTRIQIKLPFCSKTPLTKKKPSSKKKYCVESRTQPVKHEHAFCKPLIFYFPESPESIFLG